MHFSTPIISLLSLLTTTTMAMPADQSANTALATFDGATITKADLVLFPELASAFQYASEAQGCKWWKCAAIVLKAPCIIGKIADLDATGVLSCASKDTVRLVA